MQCTSCPNPWEYCEGNVCVSGVLTVDAPLNGDIVDAGASFTLGATLRRDGGASLGVRVPYEFPGKISSVVSGTPAQDTAPTVPQRMAVRFGWPAPGPNETRAVDVIGCLASVSQACAPFEGCLASTDGGACVQAFQQLEWASPGDDLLVRSERATFTSFSPVIRLTGLRAGVSPPAQVPVFAEDAGFTATATFVSMAGGTASYGTPSVTMSRTTFGPDGPKVFVAGWTGGGATTSARRVVTLDTQAPVVTVTGEPRTGGLPGGDLANPGFWVKDEVARVRVEVTGVAGVPVAGDVVVDGGVVATTAGANCTACTSSGCICATVDLKGVRFAGLTAQVPVQVPAGRFVDAVGNESVAASGSLAVTRVRWARQLALPTGTSFVAAPAVDRDGTLFVGSSNPMNWTGTVFALHPVDGGVLWQNGSLGAVQALATAATVTRTPGQKDVVFVTSNSPTASGKLRALLSDGGSASLPNLFCDDADRPMFAAAALVLLSGAQDGGTAQVGALGVFNTQGATLGSTCGYSPALALPVGGPAAGEIRVARGAPAGAVARQPGGERLRRLQRQLELHHSAVGLDDESHSDDAQPDTDVSQPSDGNVAHPKWNAESASRRDDADRDCDGSTCRCRRAGARQLHLCPREFSERRVHEKQPSGGVACDRPQLLAGGWWLRKPGAGYGHRRLAAADAADGRQHAQLDDSDVTVGAGQRRPRGAADEPRPRRRQRAVRRHEAGPLVRDGDEPEWCDAWLVRAPARGRL